MSNLQALLFDVDGTLAETERDAHRPAFNDAFAASGLDWHWSTSVYGELLCVTGGKERMKHYLENYCPEQINTRDDWDDFIPYLHKAKTEFFKQRVAQGQTPLRPGVKRLLQQARAAGLRLTIATTTTPANVEALLEHSLEAGALDWFEVIAAGDMVAAKKPAPDVYLYVLDKLGLPADACLAFEDSRNGLRAAQAAGLRTVVTPSVYTLAEDFSGAALIVDTFGEPNQHCKVLSGEAQGNYVDIEWLRNV
jgi:HAD superfamily hydrolase (TIGR01509 family)